MPGVIPPPRHHVSRRSVAKLMKKYEFAIESVEKHYDYNLSLSTLQTKRIVFTRKMINFAIRNYKISI